MGEMGKVWKMVYLLVARGDEPDELKKLGILGSEIVRKYTYRPRQAIYDLDDHVSQLRNFTSLMGDIEMTQSSEEICAILSECEVDCVVILVKKKKLGQFLRIAMTQLKYDSKKIKRELAKFSRERVVICNWHGGGAKALYVPVLDS